MASFDHILNWKLLSGSHKFPGPDGGTCINEAAIVAAGFKYREIKSASECPPCFSRVIASYALNLNDSMPHDLRQELLLPFVTRLAGTADTAEKEIERAKYIALETIRRIVPIALRAVGLEDHARRCESANDLSAARYAAAAAAAAADAAARSAARYAAAAADADAAAADAAARYAAAAAAAAAADAAGAAGRSAADAARWQIFTIATEILDAAIRLGKQADPIESALIVGRMEAAKKKAAVA